MDHTIFGLALCLFWFVVVGAGLDTIGLACTRLRRRSLALLKPDVLFALCRVQGFGAIVFVTAIFLPLLAAVHRITETLVRVLP